MRILIALLLLVWAGPALAQSQSSEAMRTMNRTILGGLFHPKDLEVVPEHYEFLPQTSNWDVQAMHPAADIGKGWDQDLWSKRWTDDVVVRKLFQNRVFDNEFIQKGGMPVLVVGPQFYKLSDLDRRRSLDLVVRNANLFNRGYGYVRLMDWWSKEPIGGYTKQGMFLD